LVCRNSSNIGETTSRGKVGLRIAYTFFVTTRSSAGLTGSSRRRIRKRLASVTLINLGSTAGCNGGRSSRVDRIQVILAAVRIGTAISTRVTRGANEGNSTKSNLLELCINKSNILVRVNSKLLAFVATNTIFALHLFVPSVGN